jgi:hypothetical protein
VQQAQRGEPGPVPLREKQGHTINDKDLQVVGTM